MNFKALTLGSLLALTSIFGGVSEAQASTWRCGRLAGFNACVVDRSHVDSIKLEWNNGDFTWIKAKCGSKTFNVTDGRRYITYTEAQRIVYDWCEG